MSITSCSKNDVYETWIEIRHIFTTGITDTVIVSATMFQYELLLGSYSIDKVFVR